MSNQRVVIYARSRDKTAVDIQAKSMQTYCQRNGYEVMGTVRDKRSGKHINRWNIRKAIKLAIKTKSAMIVTSNLSRISRNTLNVITFLNHIEKHEIKLRCADEELTLKNGNAFSKEFLKSFH